MQSFIARQTELRVLLCAAIAFAWAFSAGAAQAEALRLVTDGYANSPYSKADTNAPGFGIEVSRQVFTAMGQDVSFEFLPAARAWSVIVQGEPDGMVAEARTSARERICAFPDEPLTRGRSALFVRTTDAGKLKFASFDDLIGHGIAARETHIPGLVEYPGLSPELAKFLAEHHNMVETKGEIESLRVLAAGRVDYAALPLFLGMRDISELGLSDKIEPLLTRSTVEQDVGVCFAKGRVSPALVDSFSRALKQFKQTEAYQAIRRKYMQ